MKEILANTTDFSLALYKVMPRIDPAVADMELYEFRYCLDNLVPADGWKSVVLTPQELRTALAMGP